MKHKIWLVTKCGCMSEVKNIFNEPPVINHKRWRVPLIANFRSYEEEQEYEINNTTRIFKPRGTREVFGDFVAWYYYEEREE